MGKLLHLADGQSATVASNAVADILRDIHRNDPVARRLLYAGADPLAVDNFNGDSVSGLAGAPGSLSSAQVIAAYSLDAPITAGAEALELVATKVGGGWQVSHATIEGGTPAGMASLAFGDSSRTTFKSLQQFASLVSQNAEFDTALVGALGTSTSITGVLVDQIAEKVVLIGSAHATEDPTTTIITAVQFDDVVAIQFGE